LHSPLSAKGTDRAVHGTRDTSPESNSSLQPLSTEVQSVETLGQWASSPLENLTLAERIDRRDSYGSNALTNLYGLNTENDEISTPVSNTSPRSSLVAFKEDWAQKEKRLRVCSAQGNNPNWRLLPILIKSNDDLRQEQLASQLIHCMASILANAHVPSWLYPYDIVALSFRGGIMEAIPDTISIDSLRKNHPHFTDLKQFLEEHFGQPGSDSYENAKANFVESLAAYSIVCYMLQIKDRHNGNILLDNKGHLIHIDFGFFFLSSPGKNSGFESARKFEYYF
jgi:phosphatidylinositol kinase/protein kinase (PI-3  family)